MLRRCTPRVCAFILTVIILLIGVAIFLFTFFVLTRRRSQQQPTLRYDSRSGLLRIQHRSDFKPTISVYWDEVAQKLATAARKGPTISAAVFVVLHTSIFHAWFISKKHSKQCDAGRIIAHYAAYFALIDDFPDKQVLLHNKLQSMVGACQDADRHKSARRIGQSIALRVARRYEQLVIPETPLYPFNTSIERWQPERIPIDDPDGEMQTFLTESWGRRYTFGVKNGIEIKVPPPKAFLLVEGRLDVRRRAISFPNGSSVDLTPRHIGTVVNPEFLEQSMRVVNASMLLTPREKFIAEFWEQGPGTSYPSGCWLKMGEFVSARDNHNDHEDVGLFFALSNAISDIGVATWFVKRYYRYTRPVRAIRTLGDLHLLHDVEYYSVVSGLRVKGPASDYVTYQNPKGEPSPAFPEFVSGHSAFSAGGAEVLRAWSKSDELNAQVTLQPRQSRFEPGRHPAESITLHWKTFSEAADEAGISRIYGGIHFDDANVHGARLGRIVARKAFEKAHKLWKTHNGTL